jgi:hypothetical protein
LAITDASYEQLEDDDHDDTMLGQVGDAHEGPSIESTDPEREHPLRAGNPDEHPILATLVSPPTQDERPATSTPQRGVESTLRNLDLADKHAAVADSDADAEAGSSTTPVTSIDDLLVASSGDSTPEDHDGVVEPESEPVHGEMKSRSV